MTYAYELNPQWRTFYGACVVSSTHLGGVFASFLAGIYIDNFRITFLVGGLVGLCLLMFRSFMKECHKVTPKKVSEIAVESVENKKAILQAVIVASMVVLVFYGSLIYLNELVHQELGIPRSQIFKGNSLLLGLWIILPPIFGYIADKFTFSYRQIMRFGALGVFCKCSPFRHGLSSSSYPAILAAQLLMNIFHMLFACALPASLAISLRALHATQPCRQAILWAPLLQLL